jgi:hypothetical protein
VTSLLRLALGGVIEFGYEAPRIRRALGIRRDPGHTEHAECPFRRQMRGELIFVDDENTVFASSTASRLPSPDEQPTNGSSLRFGPHP